LQGSPVLFEGFDSPISHTAENCRATPFKGCDQSVDLTHVGQMTVNSLH